MAAPPTMYDRVGGDAFFEALVERFYDGVADDPILRPMYPDDLTDSKHHLTWFLIQFWGGPQTYSDERGHPRLRMRHVPFPIDAAARDAWLRHMSAAVRSAGLSALDQQQMLTYFTNAAQHLVNVGD